MALLVMRTTFDAPTGDSADRVIYSWGLSGPEPDAAAMEDLRDAVEGAWVGPLPSPSPPGPIKGMIHSGYIMAFHEVFLATGGPAIGVIDADNTVSTAGTGGQAPTEVQICISRLVNTPRGFNPVGRQYLGPIAPASTRLVSSSFRQQAAHWALATHNNFVFVGYEPQVIAKQGTALAAGKPISAYRVDELWDTQRRRGTHAAGAGTAVTVEVP